MSKDLFVTGACGFIGRYVAEEALRRGYKVTGADRNQSHVGDDENQIRYVQVDIRDKDGLRRIMQGKDYVIHLAAVTSNVEFIKSPAECYEINVNGFLNVLDAAVTSRCKKVVYASSAAVYSDRFSEDSIIDYRKQDNHYAKTKMINEMMASSYQAIYGISTTGLRYFNVYGKGENRKGDYASIITLFRNAKKDGEALVVYGDGKQARDLISVVDVANITLELLENGSSEVYNVGTGVATEYRAIAEMIDKRIEYIPNPLPSYQYYTRADTARLMDALGDYKCRDVETSVKEMLADRE